jgi:hypothetical protein
MGKRNKQRTATPSAHQPIRGEAPATPQCHPPKKQPILLAVSAILFVLWFVFLAVTAFSA